MIEQLNWTLQPAKLTSREHTLETFSTTSPSTAINDLTNPSLVTALFISFWLLAGQTLNDMIENNTAIHHHKLTRS